MATETILFRDDFSSLPLGKIPNDYTPWGEYHCRTDQGRAGAWIEATTHHSWAQSRGCWRVIMDGKRRVMEQQFWTQRSYPLLVTGNPQWWEYTARVELRMLSHAAPAGLVVGYRHSRDFLALLASRSALQLVHRRHGGDTELARFDATFDVDGYRRIEAACQRDSLTVALDGVVLGRVKIDFPGGVVGLIANAPARFADFVVAADPEAPAVGRGGQEVAELHALRERYPQPKLWRKIVTPEFGTDRNLRVGDINGDGRNEIVLAQPRGYLGRGDYCAIACLTAIDLDGRVLWQQGTPTGERRETTSDLCFQLHDLRGEGRAQVFYTADLRLHVADGATGETLRSVPAPDSTPPKDAAGAWPMARVIGDCLFFADLSGTGRKDTLILKDRYTRAWVYDANLTLLWDHSCKTGHYPAACDLDGDGKEELMLGYTLLSGAGGRLWELDTIDHADSTVMGRIGPPGTPPGIALAGSDAGFYLLTPEGRVLCHRKIGHAQTISVLKLRGDLPGLQIVVNTYWGEPGVTLIMDWEGAVLHEFEPMHYASLLLPVNWTHDETELVLLSGHPTEGGLVDGFGRRVVLFPDDGHPILCCDSKDIDGDGVDEILLWDHDSIWIYKPDPMPRKSPGRYPVRNPFFNESNYSGQISFPR